MRGGRSWLRAHSSSRSTSCPRSTSQMSYSPTCEPCTQTTLKCNSSSWQTGKRLMQWRDAELEREEAESAAAAAAAAAASSARESDAVAGPRRQIEAGIREKGREEGGKRWRQGREGMASGGLWRPLGFPDHPHGHRRHQRSYHRRLGSAGTCRGGRNVTALAQCLCHGARGASARRPAPSPPLTRRLPRPPGVRAGIHAAGCRADARQHHVRASLRALALHEQRDALRAAAPLSCTAVAQRGPGAPDWPAATGLPCMASSLRRMAPPALCDAVLSPALCACLPLRARGPGRALCCGDLSAC